jgi:hypothetical protein
MDRLRVRVAINRRRRPRLQPRGKDWKGRRRPSSRINRTSRSRYSRALMLGLAEKRMPSARHGRRSISCRLPRTRIGGRTVSLPWRWFTLGPASASAHSNNLGLSRRSRTVHHTAISSSIHAGILYAAIRASKKSLPRPRLPADSPSTIEGASGSCSWDRQIKSGGSPPHSKTQARNELGISATLWSAVLLRRFFMSRCLIALGERFTLNTYFIPAGLWSRCGGRDRRSRLQRKSAFGFIVVCLWIKQKA